MKFLNIFLNVIAVVSINGQFLEAEFSVGSVPLNLRSFEIRKSEGREIPGQTDDTARSSNQGRRHIESPRNIRNGPNRNVNNFNIRQDQSEFQNNGDDQVPLNRRLVNYKGQNGNTDNHLNTQTQEPSVLINNNRQSVNRNSGVNEFNNQNVALSNQDAYIQQDSRAYENYANQQNDRNQNLQNGHRRQDTQNSNDFISSNIRTSTTRTIITDNSQNRNDQNGGGTISLNEDSSKSAKDNELSNNRSRSDDKWVWTDEGTTKAIPTIIPTVDDRAAFTGDQCPTGKVKFNNSCVEKD